MAWVSANFIQFAVSRPVGEQMLSGNIKIPAGDKVESQLPEMFDAVTLSVNSGKPDESVPDRFEGMTSDIFGVLTEKAAQLTNPNKPEDFPFGYSLLPTKVEKSQTPGILAIDLSPVDMRYTTESPVYPQTAARLFIDTTPGKDGIEYFIAY